MDASEDNGVLKRQQLEALLLAAQAESRAADTKAGLLLAAIGVASGAFLSGMFTAAWSPGKLSLAGAIFWWAGAISLGASISLLGSAIFPRYSDRPLSPAAPATVFFGHAAQMTSGQELLQRLAAPANFLSALSDEVVIVARIARTKHRCIRRALWFAGLAAILAIASFRL